MIRKIVCLFWISLSCSICYSQKDVVFKSIEDALLVNPDSVYRIDLSRKGYQEIPTELMTFKNLVEIDLSKNKLTDLPDSFKFEHLSILNLTKNKFDVFPTAICNNTALTQLLMGKNKLTALPECIGELSELVILDVWFNIITEIPDSITKLRKLRSFDLRGMNYSDAFQAKYRKMLPWVTIEFETGCDCGI